MRKRKKGNRFLQKIYYSIAWDTSVNLKLIESEEILRRKEKTNFYSLQNYRWLIDELNLVEKKKGELWKNKKNQNRILQFKKCILIACKYTKTIYLQSHTAAL